MSGPDVWGPYGWKFIHYVTLGYPNNPTETDKKNYYNYFHALKYVIPCPICSKHFEENLEKSPLTEDVLSTKMKLVEWGIIMHNYVNKKNGKKEYSFDEGLKEILEDNMKKKWCNNNNIEKFEQNNRGWNWYIMIIIILAIIITIMIIYKK
jgi:hypothetical protein